MAWDGKELYVSADGTVMAAASILQRALVCLPLFYGAARLRRGLSESHTSAPWGVAADGVAFLRCQKSLG